MKILLVITIVSIIFFILYPDADLRVSGWFYEDGFFLREHISTLFFYKLIYILSYTISTILIISLILRLLSKKYPALESKYLLPRKQILFLLLTLILTPGIIVHWGFKPGFERARPVNIEQFSGVKKYTPPFVISDQNGKSFVSGHAAMGFYTVAFAFLASGRRRRIIYMSGLLFGSITALSRIAQGAHFLSDTLFAALITLLTIDLLKRWILNLGSGSWLEGFSAKESD